MVRAVFVTALTFAYTVFVGGPLIIYSLASGNSDALYRVGIWGCRLALWLAGITIEVHGRERIPAGKAVVFMPNHQSVCDPPAVMSVVPPVLVLLAKGLFRIPVLGSGMKLRGFIPVVRTNRERAMQALEEAAAALRKGYSFLVYPEGTRSRDGRLLPFKKGPFVMAIKAQAPIVPVSVSGASKIMRKGQSAIHPGVLRLTFHDPIPTKGFSLDDRDLLSELVRTAIISGLAEDERPFAPPLTARPAQGIHGVASGGRHEIAVSHGFKRTDVDGEIVLYEHPERGTLHTFSDGSWKHLAPDGRETSGTGADELAQHLRKYQ